MIVEGRKNVVKQRVRSILAALGMPDNNESCPSEGAPDSTPVDSRMQLLLPTRIYADIDLKILLEKWLELKCDLCLEPRLGKSNRAR